MTADEARRTLAFYSGQTWCQAAHDLADYLIWKDHLDPDDLDGDAYGVYHDEADADLDEARVALGWPEPDRNDTIPHIEQGANT